MDFDDAYYLRAKLKFERMIRARQMDFDPVECWRAERDGNTEFVETYTAELRKANAAILDFALSLLGREQNREREVERGL